MLASGVYLAVVQRGDDPATDETELVEITGTTPGLSEIVLTDGTRIILTEQVSQASTVRAAA